MSDTIQDLYSSFSAQMEPIQEDDRYFRYLFEMAQASDTTFDQQREELVKVVDEEWITMIEDTLDAINTIVEKPRRFITTEEEVVPVSLAKRISSDSVRHLSQNTQFLAPSDDGGIHPTKILNVETVETYDLYENRFVYHLIQRLLAFVDKRTDIIFWSTGNEIRNRFTMQSKIDDAYEEIEYKVEMTVKDRQSFAENDADNMDTFMRIDRVRRLVMALGNTSFCKLMRGCSAVRSPIQRTNLIMKDPNYRKCYQLWQFMERYDKVGYDIEVKDSALAFDDEYMVQMYTNLINNYTVFKSLLSDERNISELASQQREPLAPKFVKEIKEELVDSPDIPDVEVRRVFVEEVTQAQLAAEAALEGQRTENEELKRQLQGWKAQMNALTDERDGMAAQLDALKAREQALAQRVQVAEASLEEVRSVLADVEGAKKSLEAELELVQNEADAQVNAAKNDADERIAAATAEADDRVAAAQSEADAKIAAAQAHADAEIEAAHADADASVAAVRSEAEASAAQQQCLLEEAQAQIAALQAELASERDYAQGEIDKQKAKADEELAQVKTAARQRFEQAEQAAQSELEQVKSDAEAKLAATKESYEREAQAAAQKHADSLNAAQKEMQERISSLVHELEQAEQARERAQKRAEGNSLSRYLLAKLRGMEAPMSDDAADAGQSKAACAPEQVRPEQAQLEQTKGEKR